MKEVIGALMDEGYSPQEVREMVGPILAEMDDVNETDMGSHVLDTVVEESGHEPAVQAILEKARDARQPPGPQVAVPSGVMNSLPQSQGAKAIRVDTEDSYRAFRRSGRRSDLPEDTVEALSQLQQDELMGDFERGYASQWMLGTRIGDIMTMDPASQVSLHNDPNVNPHQTCVLCGVQGGGAICGNCHDRIPTMLGLFERGYASQWMVGLFERGAAASVYDDNPTATVVGDEEFYRRPAELSTVLGQDGFYRLPRHEGYSGGGSALLGALIGDVMALSVPSTVYAEEIPFEEKDFHQGHKIIPHVAAWRQGDHIYGSIRVAGWDGQPRVLTAATPYAKEVGIVVGYSTSAAIPPTHTLAILDPLARKLGASRLFPRLAAAAPAVLRVAHDKAAPLILTAMPEGQAVEGSWV